MNLLRNLLYALLSLLAVALGALGQENDFDWTAPNPPLPGTVYLDYGWDSTSNGPPAEMTQARSKAIRMAQAQPQPPPLPPKPTAKTPPNEAPKEPAKLTRPSTTSGFYADAGLSLRTKDFTSSQEGYFVGVGYQVSKHWGADLRLSHKGLDAEGSAIQGVGGRLVARMPFNYLAPYTFLGGTFDLERDEWRLQPGGGVEVSMSKHRDGLRIFAEGGLDADMRGSSGYQFGAGIRVRF